jgi:hypothetical protein
MRYSRSTDPSILLIRDPGDRRLVTRRCRWWDRAVARLQAPTLDRRLAYGFEPEANGFMATRAQTLVSPGRRQEVAANWEHLLEVARRPALRHNGRVPLCRDRIAEAESEVRSMLVVLVTPWPVSARGVAMASRLLSDGAGPLYNRRSPIDLVAAVRDVTAQLDPWASLAQIG